MFLAPLLDGSADRFVLVNARTGAVVASALEPAFDSAARRKGLLGRDGLPDGHAVLIAPSNAVHTWFMRFPIDVVFTARDGTVVKLVPHLGAWRIRASLKAFAVVELSAGRAAAEGLEVGDRLVVRPRG